MLIFQKVKGERRSGRRGRRGGREERGYLFLDSSPRRVLVTWPGYEAGPCGEREEEEERKGEESKWRRRGDILLVISSEHGLLEMCHPRRVIYFSKTKSSSGKRGNVRTSS